MLIPKRPAFAVATVAIALAAMPRAAHADEKGECIAASDRGQELRDDGKYSGAREAFTRCSRATCPAVVQHDCERWLGELEESAPSVVFVARDAAGNDLLDVRVSVDGQPLVDKLSGTPHTVDPGEHTFRFEAAGRPPVDQRVVIHAGEKSRVITVHFAGGEAAPSGGGESAPAPASSAPAETSTRKTPAAAYVLGGVAIAAFATEAYFGLTGLSDKSDLESHCAPRCASSDVDSVRTKFLVADIALGVGVVSLAVAAYLWFSSRSHESATQSAFVDVTPLPNGAAATLGGRF